MPKKRERTRANEEEFHNAKLAENASKRLEDNPDSSLFVVDSVGDVRRKRKRTPTRKQVGLGRDTHTQARNGNWKDQKEQRGKKEKKVASTKVDSKELPVTADFWDEALASDSPAKPSKPNAQKQPRARLTPIEARANLVSHPGTSYNPEINDHQDLIAEAVALEVRRDETEAEQAKPLSAATSIFLSADPTKGEDAAAENKAGQKKSKASQAAPVLRVNRGKLTRAERNKRNRHKQDLNMQRHAKRAKAQAAQINNMPVVLKELSTLTEDLESRKLLKKAMKDSEEAPSSIDQALSGMKRKAYAAINAPVVVVPLTDELGGSLRTIKGKSSALAEQCKAKQFAVDPRSMIKRILRPSQQKRKKLRKKRVKVLPRYYNR